MTKVKCVESLFTLSYVKTAVLWEYFQKLYKIAHKNMNLQRIIILRSLIFSNSTTCKLHA